MRRQLGLLMMLMALVAVSASSAQAASFTITPAQDLPHAYVGHEYSASFGVDPPDYDRLTTYSLAGGTLPDGLTFYAPTGIILGTPTQALQSTQFTVKATNPAGESVTHTYTLSVELLDPATNPLQQTLNSVLGLVGSLARLPNCLGTILSGTFPRPC